MPEGFKAGSAWMDVKPNIDEAEWRAKIAAAVEGAAAGSGPELRRGLTEGIQDAIPPGFTGGPGERIGKDLTDGIGRGIQGGAPDIQKKIKDPLEKSSAPAKESGTKVGAAFGAAFSDNFAEKVQAVSATVDDIVGGHGKSAGSAFSAKFGDQVKANITTGSVMAALGPAGMEALAKQSGDRSGFNFTEAMGGRVRGELPAAVEAPVEDSGKKAGAKGGQAAGKGFAGGMSPLILGAFTAAATVGPAAILGATALAVVGAGVLITKGNTQLQESYVQLGQKASAAITQAAAPLIPALYASVGVLEQGVARVGPELKSVFAAVAPEVTTMTGGLVSLVANTLPGLASGLRAIAPFAQDLAVDFGKLGSGLGGLFGALGSGASGGMTGFSALTDVVAALLPDIGKIVAGLSGGLGPALHDVANAAIPVANALADVVAALPPHVIEAAALATGALFAAFKVGTLTGIVAEGTSFLSFLVATPAAEAAVTAETEVTSVAMRGLGLAVDAALGPLGLIAAAVTLFGLQSTFATGNLASFTDKVKAAVAAQQAQKKATVDAAAAQVAATESLNNVLATNQIQLAQSAGKAGDSAVAALSFSTAQNGLNDSLSTTIAYYNEASGAASAYGTASEALFGKYQSYSDAQAKFTIDLDNAAKGLKRGKDGFDTNTAAGAANYKLMSTLATANENRAEKLLKETGSQDQANKSLQAGALALDNTARKAGFTASQIDALNLALYGTKNIGSITVPISANTGPALDAVGRMIRTINGDVAYIQVGASSVDVGGKQVHVTVGGRQLSANAGGGPVTAGSISKVGEHGEETVAFAQDAYVLTHGQTVARDSRPGTAAAAPIVNFNYYGTQRPTPEQNADMMRQLAASLT